MHLHWRSYYVIRNGDRRCLNFLFINLSKTVGKIITDENPAQIRFHTERPYTITNMNDNINMGITIAG
jgi:hypothetical protein